MQLALGETIGYQRSNVWFCLFIESVERKKVHICQDVLINKYVAVNCFTQVLCVLMQKSTGRFKKKPITFCWLLHFRPLGRSTIEVRILGRILPSKRNASS